MKYFNKLCLLVLIITYVLIFSSSEKYIFAEDNNKFKVIGYYSEAPKFTDSVDNTVQFDKLTHIIYAFLIPAEDGSLIGVENPEKLKEIVEKGHKNNVKVLIALGGWSYKNVPLDPVFEKIAASDKDREILINNVIQFLEEYNIDGVEVDWESPDSGESALNYEKLIIELNERLKEKGKYLTAALNGGWSKTEGQETSEAITNRTLEEFDWINVMSYDLNNNDHSPFWHASSSIEYWVNRGLPKEKIVIGMPCFAKPSWKFYKELVNEDRENAYKDYVEGKDIDSYYNGINTIKEKTRLALQKAAGVMLFDINEDTMDELSLLKAVNDTVKEYSLINLEEFNNKIHIIINNKELTFSKDENMGIPFIDENYRILIPVRKPLEMIGAQVSFDEENNIVTAVKNDIVLEIPIDQDYLKVNGEIVQMDTKAVVKYDRTYTPLRYIFQAFKYNIEWREETKTARISKSPI